MENELVKSLVWRGLVAASGMLAGIVALRIAAMVYRRLYNEDPPE